MKIAYITLGCKVNQYETNAIQTILEGAGHTSSSAETADIVVVNTCAVTGESARKSRQAARRVGRENPSAKLVICGCFSQSDAAAAWEMGADFVGGSGDRLKVVDYINGLSPTGGVTPAEDYDGFENLPVSGYGEHRARAYLKVQDGCSNYCTYCIIPYLRGRPRSLGTRDAVDMAVELCRRGYGEIVLTGIEISSYGRDIGTDLVTLAERVAAAINPARLRLGSLEPSLITPQVVSRLADIPNLCPHFHLSLQSGAAGVLQRMRRRYTPEQFAAVVEQLRAAFDSPAITTDLIVGFPGETEEEFRQTLDFIRRVSFSQMHIFPYSKRDRTDAAQMDGHLSNAVKGARVAAVATVAAECRAEYLAKQVGRKLSVVAETFEDGVWVGHSGNYLEVAVQSDGLRRGATYAVIVAAVDGDRLIGRLSDLSGETP